MHLTIFSNLSQVDVLFIIISLFLLYILQKNLKSLFFPNKHDKEEVLQNRLIKEKTRIENEAKKLKMEAQLEKTNDKLKQNLDSKILEFKSLATDKERLDLINEIPSWQIEDFINKIKEVNPQIYNKILANDYKIKAVSVKYNSIGIGFGIVVISIVLYILFLLGKDSDFIMNIEMSRDFQNSLVKVFLSVAGIGLLVILKSIFLYLYYLLKSKLVGVFGVSKYLNQRINPKKEEELQRQNQNYTMIHKYLYQLDLNNKLNPSERNNIDESNKEKNKIINEKTVDIIPVKSRFSHLSQNSAIKELKKQKELFGLEVISKNEYEKIKSELSLIILNKDSKVDDLLLRMSSFIKSNYIIILIILSFLLFLILMIMNFSYIESDFNDNEFDFNDNEFDWD